MISSMTGFARKETNNEHETLVWEIRSLNQRFLDVYCKLPEEWRSLDSDLRVLLKQTIQRGKIECTLYIQPIQPTNTAVKLNEPLAKIICQVAEQITQWIPNPAPISPLDILTWPGVLQQDLANDTERQARIMHLFKETLQDLQKVRQREGEALKEFILQRLKVVSDISAKIKQRIPETLRLYRERLLKKLADIQQPLEPGRLEQEWVLWANKTDIHEELDRLETHTQEMENILNKGTLVGRQLDFLLQEMNREANTLSAKMIDADIAHAGVDLKVVIEQIREQVQNIE